MLTTQFRLNRRGFMLGTAGLMAAPAILRAQGAPITLKVGRQPYAAGNAPITQKMIDDKLVEAAAKELGADVTVDWRDYPSALPMVEAFLANDLDIGMWGNTPIVRLLSQAQPLNILTLGEGHMRFVICTRKDSDIKNVEDLKGKTIGALIGGDPYNALSQILLHELGDADPRAHGITVVNTQTQVQAASVPAGMDAAVTIYPAFLKAQAELGTVGLVNSFGYTEAGYSGPAGEGAGHLLENVKKSKFYPDGYYMHRSFWISNDRVLTENTVAAEAFLTAAQRSLTALKAQSLGDVSQLVKTYWELPPELGAKVLEDEVLFQRGWIWPTEGDSLAIGQASSFMVAGGQIPAALSKEQVLAAFAKSAPILQKVWEASGKQPEIAGFEDPNAADLRGKPSWASAEWTKL